MFHQVPAEEAEPLEHIPLTQASEKTRLVRRWIEAHNSRDLEGMLASAGEDLEFHPLRLTRKEAPDEVLCRP